MDAFDYHTHLVPFLSRAAIKGGQGNMRPHEEKLNFNRKFRVKLRFNWFTGKSHEQVRNY